MTLNYAVPVGRIKLVLRTSSGIVDEHRVGGDNYCLVTIPPGVWYGFKGLSESTSLVANCATLPHDENEIRTCGGFRVRLRLEP